MLEAEGPDVGVDPHRVEDVVEDVGLGAGRVLLAVEPRPEVPAVPIPVGLSGEVVEMMVEQNAKKALAISDRGYVLEMGKNRYEGPGKTLLEDADVRGLYLGG